jgi:dCMP deaminase
VSLTKWDQRFLSLAKEISKWSKDPSTQCGAVITENDHRIVSTGFNGFPSLMEDRQEWLSDRQEKYSRIIHAEVNALIFAGRRLPEGSVLYTHPFLSCDRCVVQMLQAGIRRFVAPKPTADQLVRWGAAFERTRKYILECGGTFLEVGKESE